MNVRISIIFHFGIHILVVKSNATPTNGSDDTALTSNKVNNNDPSASTNKANNPSNYRLKPSDYLRIRTGVLGRDKGDDRPIVLTVNTRDINIFNVTDEDIKYLDSVTDTAYYGLNDKRVTDVSYRNSKYTKTFHLNLDLHKLQTRLGVSKTAVMKPNKLNLYTKGSFFKVHRDSHMPGLVATLILILPTAYTGGEIRFGDFCPKKTMDKSKLRFIYFDIGVEHSISKVKSGHRISLVYNVLDQDSKELTVDFDEMPEEVYQDMLREAIEFCKHKKNILFGEERYRNDIFYKLYKDLKEQFEIIQVAVESHCYNQVTQNVSHIDEVYDVNWWNYEAHSEEHGGHHCHDNYCDLTDMVVGKYKVLHKLFPLSTALREDSMPHTPGRGNEPVDCSTTTNIEYYAGYLINPFNMSKMRDYDDY